MTEFEKKWRSYVVWDDKNIKGFFGDAEGEYRWLSNFEVLKNRIFFEGVAYDSTECAYQAAKIYPEYRPEFSDFTPSESKKEWKNFPKMKEDAWEWDARKYDVMSSVVFEKFLRNIDLRQKLLATGDKYLEELNHWSDVYWGVDKIKGGQNNLGKILMNIRRFWANKL